MKFTNLVALALALASQLAAASLQAQSIQDFLEDQNVFAGAGRAVIRTLDSGLVVVGFDDGGDGIVDRVFTIATTGREEVKSSVMFARLASWSGHLLVLEPVQKTAYLFAASEPRTLSCMRSARASSQSDNLELSLRNRYTVTRVEDVAWVASRWGRLDSLSLDEIQSAEEPKLRSRLRLVGATLSDGSQAALPPVAH